jgi:hypothetical protein
MVPVWRVDLNHLLSPNSIEAVRQALVEGLAVGVHAYFAGGCSPDACGFSNLTSYKIAVESSRPGDSFTIWSVPALAKVGQLLYWSNVSGDARPNLEAVKVWLRDDLSREFLAIGVPERSEAPEAIFGDLDGIPELELLADRCGATGELAILPLTDLVGTGKWTPRFHVVDSKRPNEQGEIPVGGPY